MNVTETNQKILSITKVIREKYPELLGFLNEMTITIPQEESPDVSHRALSSYYDSLVNLVAEYEAKTK